MAEGSWSRFTAVEGGARLAAAARTRNTIVADLTAFTSTRLLHEEAYMIRGPFSSGKQRSVYITRASRVACAAYELRILTDLAVASATEYEGTDWGAEVEEKEVIVCTSAVLRRLLEDGVLAMTRINVLVVDSCHLVHTDTDLQRIMELYKCSPCQPRVLGLTYPLFPAKRPDGAKQTDAGEGSEEFGVCENVDDFEMYQKLEWNIRRLEERLSCQMDLAEDIDGGKRFSGAAAKPKELIVEFARSPRRRAGADSAALAAFMRAAARDAAAFLREHRYDPTEIYGEDLYEELKNIPDPTVDPELIFQQFLYVLDELGPYGADKAAFSLLIKLEKLKIKVPYERHFLLLCLCTTVLVKIRCYADQIFSKYSDMDRITTFSTPKVLRFIEILSQFDNNEDNDKTDVEKNIDDENLNQKTDAGNNVIDTADINPNQKEDALVENDNQIALTNGYDHVFNTNANGKVSDSKTATEKMLDDIEKCDFITLSNEIEDKVNTYEANLKEIHDLDVIKIETEYSLSKDVDPTNEVNLARDDFDVNKTETEDSPPKDVDPVREANLKETHNLDVIKETETEDLQAIKTKLEEDSGPKADVDSDVIDTGDENLNRKDDTLSSSKTEEDMVPKAEDPPAARAPPGPPRRPQRARGRGRAPRSAQHVQRPDALCGIVFMNEPIMAKIMFLLVVELSRAWPRLRGVSAQYVAPAPAPAHAHEAAADRADARRRARAREDALKKFRMHECNLLLATSALEEGIDLPRCNLVLRWDTPTSYRSHGLCRGRARAPRAACALLAPAGGGGELLRRVAHYRELDQMISRKCGCGIQDEPPQEEEDHADAFTALVLPYTPSELTSIETTTAEENYTDDKPLDAEEDENKRLNKNGNSGNDDDSSIEENLVKTGKDTKEDITKIANVNESKVNELNVINKEIDSCNVNPKEAEVNVDEIVESSDISEITSDKDSVANLECNKVTSVDKCVNDRLDGEVKKDDIASVDLSSAIALINRYCGKLPSDTFTRLAPSWRTERVCVSSGERREEAWVCTLRLPLNCPVKYNIVGHPMPTRALARRVAALQACRVLHRAGELDRRLLPIGKENFKAGEPEAGAEADARPGTTKRRQYYYKRTARAFTDCEPIVDTTDEQLAAETDGQAEKTSSSNVLYAISCTLWCALPERYNTRGRRLHAPQHARQAVGVLMRARRPDRLQIPSFPVYTRSGEVRVSVAPAARADTRLTAARRQRVIRFMRFVFSDVLRVRRRGMTLQPDACTANNYYVVPTVKVNNPDGSSTVDIDWKFLEQIYQYTEDEARAGLDKPGLWPERRPGAGGDGAQGRGGGGASEGTGEPAKENDGATNSILPVNETEKRINGEEITNAEDENENSKPKLEEIAAVAKRSEDEVASEAKRSDDEARPEMDEDATAGSPHKRQVKKMENPLLKPGEVFVFDAEKYREAVVTPWYRNQDQPQFFLVAEICTNLSPDSEFPSDTHASFRDYYRTKYGVSLTQPDQPLLDVDHTSARLNLLTPRYVNRKGVALPVSSERTRRAKRDRLDQKQILVPELCAVHPFAAPLWFATVALPCALYRINALLVADEIRRAVAAGVALGRPRARAARAWPPLDFGWSLAEVLSADSEKNDKKKENEEEIKEDEAEMREKGEQKETEEPKEKTINDILQEKEDAESGFEIGTWDNNMASSLPPEADEYLEPLPPNLTFCTSASGGANWCDPVPAPRNQFNPSRTFSVADSDCSYMSSDFDTDDSDLNSEDSSDTDTSGFCSSKSNAAMGVRIEYKTAHEAEAVDLERRPLRPAPQPHPAHDAADRAAHAATMRAGHLPRECLQQFQKSVAEHEQEIIQKGLLITQDRPITDILPEPLKDCRKPEPIPTDQVTTRFRQLFPYKNEYLDIENGPITLEAIEKNKRHLLAEFKKTLTEEEIKNYTCFSMVDVDIDSPEYKNEKISNIGFDTMESYAERVKEVGAREFTPYYEDSKGQNGKEFDFDFQPDLEGHPGPSPSVILQALTMSNANDGINLERLETIGDSFLKFAITAYLYCAHPTVHEGKLSHMRSKQVSNLNLYRLGLRKRLGARMIASKFEPHDNWLPPCHCAPPAAHAPVESEEGSQEAPAAGCFIPYNLITQHSIPDKSIADCVEALIGAYLLSCGPRGALLFMAWLGIRVLPRHDVPLDRDTARALQGRKKQSSGKPSRESESESESSEDEEAPPRPVGSLPPYQDGAGEWFLPMFGALRAPPSPLLRYVADPEGELEQMLSGYEALERTLQYRFRDRSLLLQALTHASHQRNRLTDCYQRLEFLGDAILDYLITRHLYEDGRRHSPGALTDLRSALVNNTIFATLAARHGFHKYFRHMSPGLNEVLTRYVRIQEENGHSISEEHYLIHEDELEQAEDVEVPKALGDLFESVAGAIFLDSGMSLAAVWRSYEQLMGAELEAFSAAAPKSPVRELLEAEPDTAKFGKPERLADGRRVRVCVEVFGRGAFKGVGRNYRIAKGTAARCALRHLKRHKQH